MSAFTISSLWRYPVQEFSLAADDLIQIVRALIEMPARRLSAHDPPL